MKVLVVEDETKTADYLTKGLREHGFFADVARNGRDGLHMAQSAIYDVVILDITLPGQDGWSVLQNMRAAGSHLPVLFLTARDSVADRVRGLELGADDYLVKPFAFSELLARIRTILKRGASRRHDLLKVSELELDVVRRKAQRAGQRLDLSPKEFSLLTLLMQRATEVLS